MRGVGIALGVLVFGGLMGYVLSRSQIALAKPSVPDLHLDIIDRMRITDGQVEALSPKLLDIGWQDRTGIEPGAPLSLWAFTQSGLLVLDSREIDMKDNPEAVVVITGTILPLYVEVAKMTGNPIQVYYDESLVLEFPSGVPEGYDSFRVG